MIVIEPVAMPAAPKPATNRPTMNMGDETAAPQMIEPNSKMAKKAKKVHYYSKNEARDMRDAHAIRTLVLKYL